MHHHASIENTNDYQHQHQHQHKRRKIQTSSVDYLETPMKQTLHESPTSSSYCPNTSLDFEDSHSVPSSISAIETIPDIFQHVMSFFVGSSGSCVDAETIQSMMLVNKRWNRLCNSKTFWKHVPKKHSQSTDALNKRLVGYAKLEKEKQQENVWKVRDRATDQTFLLEITSLRANNNVYQKRHLRDIALKETMKYVREEDKRHFSLLQDFDTCDGYSLHWHRCPDQTLDEYIMTTHDLKSRPDVIKGILFQIIHGILCLYLHGFVHCALSTDAVFLFHNNDHPDSMPLIQIAKFDHCRSHRVLEADNCYQYQDVLPLPERGEASGISSDVYAIGRAFLSMIHGTTLLRVDDIEDALKSCQFDQIIGIDGVHLLNGLLCHDPQRRISIHDAFQHPYFATVHTHGPTCCDVVASYQSFEKGMHLRQMEREYSALANLPPIRFETHQAAAMVDWLFEIASVFHLNTKTVFLAVGYYNQCCHQSVIRTLLDSSRVGSEKFQLLAATCLYIASKYEDDYHVQCANLSFSADRTFHMDDIIALEIKVLNAIDWKLPLPTIYDFVTFYMAAIGIGTDSPTFWLSLYISELALASTIHTEFAPSMIASCALVLSQYTLKTEYVWSTRLEITTGYKWEDLSRCLIRLSTLLRTRHDFQEVCIIDRRYKKMSRMGASTIDIKVIESTTQLDMMENLVQTI